MRPAVSVSLALLVAASACQPHDALTADADRDAAARKLGESPAGTYVLRSVAGTALPAVLVSHETHHVVVTSDTIFLHADGIGASTSTRQVTEVEPAGERTERELVTFTYTITGGRLTAEIPCFGLATCLALPHYAGTVSADAIELDLALNYRVPLQYAKVAGPSDVAEVRITPSADLSVRIGGTLPLAAAAIDAQSRPLAGRTASWTSLVPSVATVTDDGVVRSVTEGSALIMAFIGGRADTVAVRVDR